MPVTLFTQRNLVAASLASMGQLGSAFGFFFLCSIFLQTAVGLSPLQAGFALLPMSIVSALVSHFAAPVLANRRGARFAFITGLGFQGAGVLAFAMADAHNGLAVAVVASVLLGGFGMGLSYPSVSLVALQGIPAELQASASGVQNTALQTGGALGTALVATVIGTFGSNFAALAPAVQLTARNGCVAALAALVASSIVSMALFSKAAESASGTEQRELSAGPL
jgi:MFS family permease